MAESGRFDQNYVGTEHLLLGLAGVVTAERLGPEPVRVFVSPGSSTSSQRAEVHEAIAAVYRALDGGEPEELEDARMKLADAIESLRASGGNVLFREAPQAAEEG